MSFGMYVNLFKRYVITREGRREINQVYISPPFLQPWLVHIMLNCLSIVLWVILIKPANCASISAHHAQPIHTEILNQ